VLPVEIIHDAPRITAYDETTSTEALQDDVDALDEARDIALMEICPRGNNNIVIIIFLVHDNVYTPCYNCIKRKH
jgi:hypothetical protein